MINFEDHRLMLKSFQIIKFFAKIIFKDIFQLNLQFRCIYQLLLVIMLN